MNRIHDESPIILDEDAIVSSRTKLGRIIDAAKHINTSILQKASRGTVFDAFYVMEAQIADLTKILGYDGHLEKEREERYIAVKTAHQKIDELQLKLADIQPINGLAEKLVKLGSIVENYWHHNLYFSTLKEKHFSCYYKSVFKASANMFFSDGTFSTFEEKPVTKRKSFEEHIKNAENEGLILNKTDIDDIRVVDSQLSKDWITNKLVERFPSLTVDFWKSMRDYRSGGYFLIEIGFTINDLGDI